MELRFKSKNGWHIYGWMIHNLDLNGTERDIYAIVFGFSQDEDSMFYGGLKYLEQGLKISKNTAINMLKKLVEKNLIIKITEIKNGVTFNYYQVNPKYSGEIDSLKFLGKNINYSESEVNKNDGGGENFAPPYQNYENADIANSDRVAQNLVGGGENFAPPGENFGHTNNNIQYKSNHKKERGEKENFFPPSLSEVIEFFQKWNIKASAENFFNHWESVGWKKSGGLKIVKWQNLVPKWEKDENDFEKNKKVGPSVLNAAPKKPTPDRERFIENFKKKTRGFVEQLQQDASALETARIKFNKQCNHPKEFNSQAVYNAINDYQIKLMVEPHLILDEDIRLVTIEQFKIDFFAWFKKQKHGPDLFSDTPNSFHTQPQLQQ